MPTINPDYAFASDQLARASYDATLAHKAHDFELALRQLRLASRALADMRRATLDMLRWAHQAESM
jgi:hypothetical protein